MSGYVFGIVKCGVVVTLSRVAAFVHRKSGNHLLDFINYKINCICIFILYAINVSFLVETVS